MTAIVLFLLFTCCAGAAGTITCSGTATTLSVSWAAVDATDLYYIALSETATSRPFALQTSPVPSVRLIDLVPSTSYYLTLRSHPSSEQIVWGWRPPASAPVLCTTAAERTDAPNALRRTNNVPSTRILSVEWQKAANQNGGAHPHSVGIRISSESEWQWEAANATTVHSWHGLQPGQYWEVVVRDEITGLLSEVQSMRTATEGTIHTTAYRISEFVFEPDFLENHDTANKIGISTYLTNGGAKNETEVMEGSNPGGADHEFNKCQSALAEICPGEKGGSFQCMACMDKHRAAVVKSCGNYTDANDYHGIGGWAIHYFCGIGWPESTFQQSPITEYCVEHLMASMQPPCSKKEKYE
jgi:hypothetical protein